MRTRERAGATIPRPDQKQTATATQPDVVSVDAATDRKLIRRAARVLRGAAAQAEVDGELLAAAELVVQAGGRR